MPKPVEYRYVVDRADDRFTHGHRESNDGSGWQPIPRSDYVKLVEPLWFWGNALDRMKHVGVETSPERAGEFEQAIDSDPSRGYYYLSHAVMCGGGIDGVGDETLKWIMGALAAELNTRKMQFSEISRLMPSWVLGVFCRMILEGKIDRTFTKQIFAELVKMSFDMSENPTEKIEALVADPRFKAVDESALDGVLDKIIAENPDQFEQAKANPKLIQWFVGQTMKATGGKAKAPAVIEIMTKKLSA